MRIVNEKPVVSFVEFVKKWSVSNYALLSQSEKKCNI